MNPRYRTRLTLCAATLAVGGLLISSARAQDTRAQQTPMSLDEARRTVNMLNDLYVTSVVGIHATYVKDRSTPAAAVVARQVFKSMADKGWPETRRLSTTGRPFNPDANPKDQFEKDAVAALKKGEARVRAGGERRAPYCHAGPARGQELRDVPHEGQGRRPDRRPILPREALRREVANLRLSRRPPGSAVPATPRRR